MARDKPFRNLAGLTDDEDFTDMVEMLAKREKATSSVKGKKRLFSYFNR